MLYPKVKKNSCFISTKPLQFVNCCNIEDENIKLCCIVDNFYQAKTFYSSVKKYDNNFDKYIFARNKFKFLAILIFKQRKFGKLYIDSDYGLSIRFLLLFFFNIDIYIYEEGYASYEYLRKPDCIKNRFLLFLLPIFHIRNWNGGGCKVKGIYLYDKNLFKKNIKIDKGNFKTLNFKLPFKENILSSKVFKELFSGVNMNLFKDKNIFIYITSWTYRKSIIKYIQKYSSYYKILKLHPHIKDEMDIKLFNYILPRELLVEYFLFYLQRVALSIHIVHEGSFAIHYLKPTAKLTIENISNMDLK